MRTTLSICLVLLAGCASAHTSEPQTFSIRRLTTLSTDAPATKGETVKGRRIEVNGACQTNDRMAVRAPFTLPGTQPEKTAAPGRRTGMPNAPMLRSLPYIPNACPVTAGPLATRNVPAVLARPAEVVPVAPKP